jgi:hypothetical protein
MKLTRKKIRGLVVEELRLRAEADTQEMEAVDLSKTLELSPVEFAQELKRQQEVENYSEADMLNMWRQWSAAKRKKAEEDIPDLPASAVAPMSEPRGRAITATQSLYPDADSDEELARLQGDPEAAERAHTPTSPPRGGATMASAGAVGAPGGAGDGGGRKYQESERLFRHFFGDYDETTLNAMMTGPENETLKDIILQLYGWQLPRYRRTHSEPGTDVIKIAQEFEKEGKNIDGREDEFIERLQAYQYKTGKTEFEKVRMPPEQEAEDWAIKKLTTQKNLPPRDTVRAELIPKYIEYVKSKHPEEYKQLYDLALHNFEKFREEKS